MKPYKKGDVPYKYCLETKDIPIINVRETFTFFKGRKYENCSIM